MAGGAPFAGALARSGREGRAALPAGLVRQADDAHRDVVRLVALDEVVLRVGDVAHDEAALQAGDVDDVAGIGRRVDVGPADRRAERHLLLGRGLVARAEDPAARHAGQVATEAAQVAQAVAQLRADAHEPGDPAVRGLRPELEARGLVELPVIAPARRDRRVVDLRAGGEPPPAAGGVGDDLLAGHLARAAAPGEELGRP